MIRNYISHVKKQDEQIKMIHSVFVAGLLTGLFAGIYLYLVRGVSPDVNVIVGKEEVVYNSEK